MQLLPAVLAAFIWPLPLSCSPCHHHAAPAAIMQPLSPSCGPCRCPAAPATVMRPLPLSWPLLPSCHPCRCPAEFSRCKAWPDRQPLLACGHQLHCLGSVIRPQSTRQTYLPAPHQLPAEAHKAWKPAGFVPYPAAPAAIMRPLPPSCAYCHRHAAPAAVMWPLPPSCGPLLPSCGPLQSSCGPLTLSCGP
jgi:hypothetical protein